MSVYTARAPFAHNVYDQKVRIARFCVVLAARLENALITFAFGNNERYVACTLYTGTYDAEDARKNMR